MKRILALLLALIPVAVIAQASLPVAPPSHTLTLADPSYHDNRVWFQTTGPDGQRYRSWHPPVAEGRFFAHEHGSNPDLFAPGARAPFGYVSTRAGLAEPHEGYKQFVYDDLGGYRWFWAVHLGSTGMRRVCQRYHEVQVSIARSDTREVLATLRFLGDFGRSVRATDGTPYAPAECPDQAAVTSHGERRIPVFGDPGYEPWRVDTTGLLIGASLQSATFNTPDPVAVCADSPGCSSMVPTGNRGVQRFVSVIHDGRMWLRTPPHAGADGTFWTDPYGRELRTGTEPDAVRQFVRPGVDIVFTAGGGTCVAADPFSMHYVCGADRNSRMFHALPLVPFGAPN